MLSALAIVKPSQPKKKKAAQTPRAHEDSTIEYSDFVPLPPEKNVPDPAPLRGLAFDAGEVDPEPEEVDEWNEMMKAAENDADEWDSESKTDVAPSSEFEDDDDDEESGEGLQHPMVWTRKVAVTEERKQKVFVGTPLDFDDEFIP